MATFVNKQKCILVYSVHCIMYIDVIVGMCVRVSFYDLANV